MGSYAPNASELLAMTRCDDCGGKLVMRGNPPCARCLAQLRADNKRLGDALDRLVKAYANYDSTHYADNDHDRSQTKRNLDDAWRDGYDLVNNLEALEDNNG